jgi:hypothetical protein
MGIPVPPWEAADGRTLADVFGLQQGPGNVQCRWQLGQLQGSTEVEAAAWHLAEKIMEFRCGGATQTYEAWRRCATGGAELSSTERVSVAAFVKTGFGLRGTPAPADHIQGYVAEFIWFLLARERPGEDRSVAHVEPPKAHVTAPGADALVIYRISGAPLFFRLWEIKKHASSAHLSKTVGRAAAQLSRNGIEYLAQLVPAAPRDDSAVAELYGQLVDLWRDADARAGVGVAIATSLEHAPRRRAFSTMHTQFPLLDRDGQLEGLVAAIADFPQFAERVRGFVWSGLST